MYKIWSDKLSLVVAFILLLVFTLGVVYDPCAQDAFSTVSSETSLADLSASPDVDTASGYDVDCHCLCHFAFSPEASFHFGPSGPYQSFRLSLNDLAKESLITAFLRPPISLL